MTLFLYGTLMDVDVMSKVLDRPFAERELLPATLSGWRRHAVRSASYPVILPDAAGRVEGRLMVRPAGHDLARIRHFESEEYLPQPVRVGLGDGSTVAADVFVALDGVFEVDEGGWDLAIWRERHKLEFMRRCDDWMRDCPWPVPA